MATAPDRSGIAGGARLEVGVALVAVGAVVLLVSLFLHWYEPGRSAWTVFEVWDLVLAALAIWALLAVAGQVGLTRPRPGRWLVVPSVATLVIVVASLLDHPPAAIGAAPMVGIWLALGASVLMVAGAAMSLARVSVAIEISNRVAEGRPAGGVRREGLTSRLRRRAARPVPSPVEAGASSAPPPSGGEPPTQATRPIREDATGADEPPREVR